MSLAKKLKRKTKLEKDRYINDVKLEAKRIAQMAVDKAMDRAFQEGTEQASDQAIAMVMAVSAEILLNDFGKLQKKETRLQEYVRMLNERLQKVDKPSRKQLEAEAMLYELCGVKIGRMNSEESTLHGI